MACFLAALVVVAGIADSSNRRLVHLPPGVQVTPDGSWVERAPNTNGYSAVFRVKNTQSSNATYTLTRESSANVTTTGQSHSLVTLGPGDSVDVTVNYNVGAAGAGWVKLWAEGSGAFDSGTWNVAVGHTVAVTPDGQTGTARITQTGGYTETFTVKNNGGNIYTYVLNCSGSSNIACTSVNPASVTLNPAAQTSVVAAYSVGKAGTGTLRVVATYGSVTDTGSYSVPVNNPLAGAPIMDASPHYGHFSQNMARCAMSCFAATYAQSIVPYFSLDAPRSVTLAYHGDRVNPKPFVHVNVRPDSTYGQTPTEYKLEVKVSGARVPFVNGDTILRFAYPGNTWARLGGQFDRSSYATNVYPMEIIVSAYYSGGGGTWVSNSWNTKLVLVNENDTLVARGWTLAGVQRLYTQGDGSALITEGEGSAVYFAKVGSVFVRPAGEFSQLVSGQPGGGAGWTRAYADSTKVVFNSQGYMIELRDRFSNITTIVPDTDNRVWKVKDPLNNAITLTYDGNGLTSIQDPGGRVTDIVAASKRLTTITDPDNVSTTFDYDGSGRLVTITNRRGHTTTLAYDPQSGKLATITAPAISYVGTNGTDSTGSPVTTLAAWHKGGVPYSSTTSPAPAATAPAADAVYASVTDPGGHVPRFTANGWGAPATSISVLGDTTRSLYDPNGLPIRVVYPTGVKDTVGYNARGLPIYVKPAGRDSAMHARYAAWAQVDSVWGFQVPLVRNFIGANGRVDSTLTLVGSASAVTRFMYETRGRVERITDPENHVAGRTWYAGTNGNRSMDSLPGGRITTYGYDTYGRATSVSAPGLSNRFTGYDAVNRVLKDSVAGYAPTIYAYDSLFLKSVTDPKGQVYKFAYNALGWTTARTDPANRADTLRYDRDGLLRRWKNRRAVAEEIRYSYDAGHRPIGKGGTNTDTTTWTYSVNGLTIGAVSPSAVDSQFFSATGRLDSVRTRFLTPANQTFSQRFRYTVSGQLDSVNVVKDGGGITFLARKYRWSAKSGALDTIRLAGGGGTALTPNKDLQLTATRLPGADVVNRAYTSTHSEATISTGAPYAASVARFLSFDVASRISRQVEGNGYLGREYTYDGLGRLLTDSAITFIDTAQGNPCTGDPPPDVDENGNLCTYDDPPGFWRVDSGHAYTYDAVGNRLDQGGSYAVGNRIRQLAGCAYVTDSLGDGNVLSRTCGPQTVRFHWTAESRLKALQVVGGDSLDFRYDASGRLIRKDVNSSVQAYFLWQGDNLLAELTANATGKVAEYSYYPGLDNLHALITGTTPYFAHADGIGNVIALTDSATKRVRRWYDYDDWGTLTGGGDSLPFTNADRARFKGALWQGPEADLYYMRARWYEPKSGRFLSEDPTGLGGGINPYVYVHNDPMNFKDPLGTEECPPGTQPWREVDEVRIGERTIQGRFMECRGPHGELVYIAMGNYTGPAPGDGRVPWGLDPRIPAQPIGVGASSPERTPQQCFDESTAPVRNAAGALVTGVAVLISIDAISWGSYQRSLPPLVSPITGFPSATATVGAKVFTGGVFGLVGTLGLVLSYFAATSIICHIDPDWL